MKRRISLLLAVVMILGSFSFAFANDAMTETDAGAFLKDKGVLQGINGELKLEDKLRREDAVVMIARLHGAEEEAEAFPTEGLTFKDVKDPYYQSMISWAVANNLIEGHNAEKFGYHEDITAQHYATILLRALGYGEEVAEKAGYDKALELAAELGLLEGVKVENKTPITRGQMAVMTYDALGTKMKDSEETLADKLEIEMPKPAALEVEEVKADNLKEVVVRFNQKVDKATVTNANVSVDKNKGSAALAEDGVTVVITMDKALVNQKAYTAVVKGVKSVGGLEIAETKVDFKAFDRTLPEVEDIVVTGPRSFELVFSEPISKDKTAQNGKLEIKQGNTKVGHKVTVNDTRKVAVDVYTNLQEGKEYEVTVNGFEDFAGYKNIVNTLKFTYEKDTTPPVAEVVKAEQTYVHVKFNKPVTGLDKTYFYHTFNAWDAVGLYETAVFTGEGVKEVKSGHKALTEVYVLFHDGNKDNKDNRPLPEGDVRFGINGAKIKDNWDNALGQFETTVKVSADKVAPEVAKVEVTGVKELTVTFNKDVKFEKANVDILDTDEKKIDGLDWTVEKVTAKKYKIKLTKDMTGKDITLILKDVVDTALVPNKMATYTEVINVTDKSALTVKGVYYSVAEDEESGALIVIFNKDVDGDTALNVKNYVLVKGSTIVPLTETPDFDQNSARVRIPLDKDQVKAVKDGDVRLQVIGVKDLAGNVIAPTVTEKIEAAKGVNKLEVTSISAPATNKIVVEFADRIDNVDKKFFKITTDQGDVKDFGYEQTENGGVTVLEFVLGKYEDEGKEKAYEFKTDLSDLTFEYQLVDGDGIKNSFGTIVENIYVKDVEPENTFGKDVILDEIAPAMKEKTYVGNTITIKYSELVDGNALSNGTFAVKGNTVEKVEIAETIVDERYSDTVEITVEDDLTEAPTITQLQAVKDKAGNAYTAKDPFTAEPTAEQKKAMAKTKVLKAATNFESKLGIYTHEIEGKTATVTFGKDKANIDNAEKAAEEAVDAMLAVADEVVVTIGEEDITITKDAKNIDKLVAAVFGTEVGAKEVTVSLKLTVDGTEVEFKDLTVNFVVPTPAP